MTQRLSGKVVLITGASGGIGAAAAALFSREGAALVLVGRDEARLAAAAAACDPERTRVAIADMRDSDAIHRAVDLAVSHFGGVDVLFANAGDEGNGAPIEQLGLDEFDRVMATNVRGAFVSIQRVIPSMRARGGGSIIVTSSLAANLGFPCAAAYCASKAALLGLVRAATVELAPAGIRVNALLPGGVDNRMLRAFADIMAPGHAEAVLAQYRQMIPARRVGTNEEMAKAALFLASDDASYCHGAALTADGGLSIT